jgi:hypothetical protein
LKSRITRPHPHTRIHILVVLAAVLVSGPPVSVLPSVASADLRLPVSVSPPPRNNFENLYFFDFWKNLFFILENG